MERVESTFVPVVPKEKETVTIEMSMAEVEAMLRRAEPDALKPNERIRWINESAGTVYFRVEPTPEADDA